MFELNLSLNLGNARRLYKSKSFEKFCLDSDYPKPYKKQIRAYDFIFTEPWTTQVKVVLGARGYGKTDYGPVLGVGHRISEDPGYRALLLTKEAMRGKEIVQETRECIIKNKVIPKNRSTSVIRLPGLIGKDPNYISKSIRSKGLRGRHPDIALMDDPITPDDDSPAERRRVFKVYEEVLKLAPRVAIYGQPVHKLDLYQTIRDKVPCIEMIYGDIPELDVDLNAQRLAGVSEKSIQASYFLKIEDDLSMPFLKIEEIDFFPAGSAVAFCDPANKGGNGRDYTAIQIGRMCFDNFAAVGFAFPKAWEDCLEEMKIIFRMFHVKRLYFANTTLGSEPVKRLNQLGMTTIGYTERGDKHGRIMRMAIHRDSIKLTRVKDLPPDLREANNKSIELVKQYEYNTEYDDPPDALSSLMEKVGLIKANA